MMPPCYNRPPFPGMWVRAGYRRGKVLLRFIPSRMTSTCKNWISSGDLSPDPIRNGWNCVGCQRLPEEGLRALRQLAGELAVVGITTPDGLLRSAYP